MGRQYSILITRISRRIMNLCHRKIAGQQGRVSTILHNLNLLAKEGPYFPSLALQANSNNMHMRLVGLFSICCLFVSAVGKKVAIGKFYRK